MGRVLERGSGSWRESASVFSPERSLISSGTVTADRRVTSDALKSVVAGDGVSLWVSSEQVRVMAGALVGGVVAAVSGRVIGVGPDDKRDKARLSLARLLTAMRTATAKCGQQE